ncbi:hypothetical protein [Wolbachia endosymbiont of Cardiocondyla obscurior]|uniref:hypothetical protein n=1 Tax=Wolbachia endosymbiont of Cardiocondyla obscurior TaxID=2687307 RepID=UPI00157A9874|nr:hypothetical protein [Wolbachia endosymbiont of Cardiocondyla obscurior]
MYNKNWIPDWNDTEGATGMTGERGTGMTREGTWVTGGNAGSLIVQQHRTPGQACTY